MPSTVIRSFDYHQRNRALDVTFVNGRAYRYADVPEPVAQAFSRAPSKGRFFNDRIRDAFRFTRLDPQPSRTKICGTSDREYPIKHFTLTFCAISVIYGTVTGVEACQRLRFASFRTFRPAPADSAWRPSRMRGAG